MVFPLRAGVERVRVCACVCVVVVRSHVERVYGGVDDERGEGGGAGARPDTAGVR
jgi:hypothetical protein